MNVELLRRENILDIYFNTSKGKKNTKSVQTIQKV